MPFPQSARADLDPSLPPSSNFDLSHWKLTLPVDAQGGITAVATEVRNLADYRSDFFYTAADGGMVFRASVNGASTKGSSRARSELREMLDPRSAAVNWTDATQSVLEANLKVQRVPSATGKLVIGQIHGYDTAPLVKLQYEHKNGSGKVTAIINPTPVKGGTIVKYTLATNVALNRPLYYRVKVYKRVLYLSANGSPPIAYAIDRSWQGIGMYFKAGVYLQADGSDSADYGQATFYRLAATHPDNKLAIQTKGVASAQGGAAYRQPLTASGGLGAAQWSLVSGRLPEGLALESATGVIAGVPAAGAADGKIHGFSVMARDQAGATVAKTYSLYIAPAILPLPAPAL